ncbi:xanthine dehydrogenase small subunit [Dermacoccaceae bacterium W4C1]
MQVTVNGAQAPMEGIAPHTNALDWLRGRGLTGCKEGCAEGECGACAVLVARPDDAGGTRWTAINSCLVPAASLEGQEVVTSEGLGSPQELHPVQAGMASLGGSQCGYCTPGFICSMASEYYRPDRGADEHAGSPDGEQESVSEPAEHTEHECGPNGFDLHALSGNLCRCTGYRPIRDAAYGLGEVDPADELAARRSQPAPEAVGTDLQVPDGRFLRPTSLAQALQVMQDEPEAVPVAGATDWGVEANLRLRRVPLLLAVDRVPEMRELSEDADGFTLGAALTLSELERRLEGRIPLLGQLFPQFASRLIRNGATIGGNLGTGSPIGDTPPALLGLEAVLVLDSVDGRREVPLAEYFTGYRQSVRRPDELITAVRIPKPLASLTAFHKIAKRRFDDISSVAVGFAIEVADGTVSRAAIGLGGVAATPVRAREAEQILIGSAWEIGTVRAASAALAAAGTPMDDHRASSAYRKAMLGTALYKLFAQNRTETVA